MASGSEQSKGKATATPEAQGAARPRARRAPTNAEVLAAVREIRGEILNSLEKVQAETMQELATLRQAVADLSVFVLHLADKQGVPVDTETMSLREKLEVQQAQAASAAEVLKRPEAPSEVKEQAEKTEASRPRARVKVAVSRKDVYGSSRRAVKLKIETSIVEGKKREPPVAPMEKPEIEETPVLKQPSPPAWLHLRYLCLHRHSQSQSLCVPNLSQCLLKYHRPKNPHNPHHHF